MKIGKRQLVPVWVFSSVPGIECLVGSPDMELTDPNPRRVRRIVGQQAEMGMYIQHPRNHYQIVYGVMPPQTTS